MAEPARPSRPPVCRYFFASDCRVGIDCRFAHSWSAPLAGAEARGIAPQQAKVCAFHASGGGCHFGASCRFMHESSPSTSTAETASIVENSVNVVGVGKSSSDELEFAGDDLLNSFGEDESSFKCGVCFENVLRSGKRFGLLENCDHVFCLDCLREWRRSDGGSANVDTTVTRSCPMCRTLSHFVVPSPKFAIGAEKEQIFKSYIGALAHKPCRYFSGGVGLCNFGPNCFYAHTDAQGNDVKPAMALKWESESKLSTRRVSRRRDLWRDTEHAALDTAHMLRQLLSRMDELAINLS